MKDTRDPHSRALDIDAEISRLYQMGEGTMAISKRLGLRPALVISRVRGLKLAPPGMASRSPIARKRLDAAEDDATADGHPPSEDAQPDPESAQQPQGSRRRGQRARRARTRSAATTARGPKVSEEDEGEEDEFPASRGRPRGWLMTEREHFRLFARHGERFQDVLLKHR